MGDRPDPIFQANETCRSGKFGMVSRLMLANMLYKLPINDVSCYVLTELVILQLSDDDQYYIPFLNFDM